MFKTISFDIIDILLKGWFWFEFWLFKAVVDTKRIKILVKGCNTWYIHGSGCDTFQMIIFDIINSLFKSWFWFEFICFNAVIDTKWINCTVKGYDSTWIRVIGGDNFQKIIFDLINCLFKCLIRFEFFCFKAVVHNKLIKMIVKVCSNFSNK